MSCHRILFVPSPKLYYPPADDVELRRYECILVGTCNLHEFALSKNPATLNQGRDFRAIEREQGEIAKFDIGDAAVQRVPPREHVDRTDWLFVKFFVADDGHVILSVRG